MTDHTGANTQEEKGAQMISLWYAIVRVVIKLNFIFHVYRINSWVYRNIWERQCRNVPLRIWHKLSDLGHYIQRDAWRSDGFRGFFDAVSYPGKAELVFSGRLDPKEDFDCDDFAIFLAATLERCKNAGTIKGIVGVSMLSVNWGEGWRINGHSVCLVSMAGEGFYYMDYGAPVGPFTTATDAAFHVVKSYGRGFAVPLFMYAHDANMRPLKSVGL